MSNVALYVGLACIGVAIVLVVLSLAKDGLAPAETSPQPAEVPVPQPAGVVPQGAVGPGLSAPLNYAVPVPVSAPLPPVLPPQGAGPAPGRTLYPTMQELPPLMQRMRRLALRLSPSGYTQWLRRRLDYAGNPPAWPADRLVAFKGIGLLVGLLLGALVGLGHGAVIILLALGAGAFLFVLPDLLIYNAGDHRQAKLLKGLPDALDMMTVCVEAGLGFDSALSRVALTLEGPIAVECARVLQEMQFGMSRTQALRSLADRTKVAEIRTFVSAMVQSSELGISIGIVLREQAKEMRVRRRQRAEEKAQKLQVKIVVPLVFCLLPALFIIVIGPGILNIIHAFGHAHH